MRYINPYVGVTRPNTPLVAVGHVPSGTGKVRVGLGLLWVLAVLLFGAVDLFTTAWALGLGAVEVNPLASYLMSLAGGSIWPLAAFKVLTLGSFILLSYIKMGKRAWIIPAVVSVAAALLLIPNIAVLAALL